MTTSEKRIAFINLEFTNRILEIFRDELSINRKDQFILSMSWPWRAPDRGNFNSAFFLSADEVIRLDPLSWQKQKIEIQEPEQLRIRTIPQGISTIRFSFIYVDISDESSLVVKILKAIGDAAIGESTAGMSEIWKAGVESSTKYNLEQAVESVSGGERSKHILGRASLKFNGQNFNIIDHDIGEQALQKDSNKDLYPVPLKDNYKAEIMKLWIKI